MDGAPKRSESTGKQAAKALGLAAWIVAGLMFWGGLAAAALLGSAMAEPSAADADFTLLYIMIVLVALIFAAWCAATWTLLRRMRANSVWLAFLFALPLVAWFLI